MITTQARSLLLFALLAATPTLAAEPVPADKARIADGIAWYDVRTLGVEGQGWTDTAAPFDRLPARAEEKVRSAVWGLSHHSAGLAVRFVTDATTIQAHWKLISSRLDMPHMPATGVSGLDLYVRTDDGKWRWLANGRPAAQENTATLVSNIPAGTREYILYFPLYNGVSEVEIGIPEGATLSKADPRESGRKPIVFYGTSITQGGCASRPGMVHTAILGRWLDAPVINLGFSGNGRMEAEVAEFMAELDPSVYVIDCLPNISAGDVTSRTEPLVRILRAAHPEVPIVLVEDRNYTDSFLIESKRTRNESSQAALRAAFERLKAAGDENLYYIEGADLLGDDSEGTVDSSHPTDLGFYRQSEAMARVLRPILEGK
ncbi:SGNH/GDSL hydrolase family protein [Maioricimonas sp. JC845]|uniref:SGNH/GDSL hydrolase family protein n=1 Tax=Maioricimonas sp. JC845 TaxID=3232138 RepID=UPI00345A56B0